MKNFKFTGINIAAAVLIIAFFLPWIAAMGNNMSLSGFSITTTGISPGMLSMFLNGKDRLMMILVILIPVSAGIILYQNITGDNKFGKYYRPSHFIPAIILVLGLALIYFKMKPAMPDDFEGYSRSFRSLSKSMQPGLFDVLGFGVYASLAAAAYLVLAITGKIKDKEYYKPTVAATETTATDTHGHENNNAA